MLITKNRNRGNYTFANINLLGKCNANCYFCLGKDIENQLMGKNQLNTHFSEWNNFNKFLNNCKENNIKKLYLTGQTADGLQYHYLDELLDYLQVVNDFSVGVRTNGYLAQKKISSIQKMRDEIGYSIHTLRPEVNKLIMGRADLPDWKSIIPNSGDNVRIAIVLGKYNITEFYDILKYLEQFNNIRYIQVRRISTDTRYDLLEGDIRIYEEFYNQFRKEHRQVGDFNLAQHFEINNQKIFFWRTVETSANSLNYFTDGTISNEYFIVEGYLKNQEN